MCRNIGHSDVTFIDWNKVLYLQGEGYVSGDDDLEEGKRPAKKRRYAAGLVLDQTNCKFGIKLEGDEVVLMSDESEVSSLNDVEVEHLKKAYEKVYVLLCYLTHSCVRGIIFLGSFLQSGVF